jgi:hypothetical protein
VSDFLVSPPAQTDWRFDADDFAARLAEHWPDAEIVDVSHLDIGAHLRFELVPLEGGYPLLGHLAGDGQVIGLEGGLEESAAVAEWARAVVPREQELIFWDQGYSFDVRLTEGITREQIVAAVEK